MFRAGRLLRWKRYGTGIRLYPTHAQGDETLLLAVFSLLVGIALLTRGADVFVDGAAAIARQLGVGPLVVGVLVVGFSTSAPEMLVALMAGLGGAPALGIGNAYGSNITNIALVLGITVMFRPLTLVSQVMRWEMPILLASLAFGSLLLGIDGLSRGDGALMLVALVAALTLLAKKAHAAPADDPMLAEFVDGDTPALSPFGAWGRLIIGLICLLLGSRALVFGATFVVRTFGVPELVIGLTVVAVGTSLPELAASVVSARRGHPELALGNIIGSNIFNALGVLAMPALSAPGPAPHEVLVRDIPVTFGLSVLLWWLVLRGGPAVHIGRPAGALLLGLFVGYQMQLFFTL